MERDTIDKTAKMYFMITVLTYVVLCICLGHPTWIFSVFIRNLTSDITAQTPRMLSSMYRTLMASSYESLDQWRAANINFRYILIAEVPAAFQFSCIDAFVVKRIKGKDTQTKLCSFFGAYVLQAIIAVSWTDPVTWKEFSKFASAKLASPLISAIILIVVGYFVYNLVALRNEDIHELISVNVVNVLMTPIYELFIEMIKALFLMGLFCLTFMLAETAVTRMNLTALVNAFAILAPLYFILLNRGLSKISDFLSGVFMHHLIQDANPEYRKTFMGEIFCLFLTLLSIICCIWLQFKLK